MKPISMGKIHELEALLKKDLEESHLASWSDHPMLRMDILPGGAVVHNKFGISWEDFSTYSYLAEYCHRRGTGEIELSSFPDTLKELAEIVGVPSKEIPDFLNWIESNTQAFDHAFVSGVVSPCLFPDHD